MKLCKICGNPVRWKGRSYCGPECMKVGMLETSRAFYKKRVRQVHNITCCICGISFQHHQNLTKTCGDECRKVMARNRTAEYKAKKKAAAIPAITHCKHCGNEFKTAGNKLYCSSACRTIGHPRPTPIPKPKIQKLCKVCRSVFLGHNGRKVCSKKCRRRIQEKRKQSKPHYRIKKNLRSRLAKLLKGFTGKSALVGCTTGHLKTHLQSQFQKGMNWENYGTHWVVDHKLPLAAFDLTKESQRQVACHYSNLQPLTYQQNALKADNITEPQMPLPI